MHHSGSGSADRSAAVVTTLLLVGGGSSVVLLSPLSRPLGIAVAVAILLAVARLRGRAVRPAPSRALRISLALVAMLATLAIIELGARALTSLGVLEVHRAMRTLLPPGTEDWRVAHITADDRREPDPVLLWRPRASPPYTKQRFKGPLVVVPKPAGVVRVICYGDSNTDGPDQGGWTERLEELLAAYRPRDGTSVKFEVLNAGVAGYSSYQGLMRLRLEIAEFQPDIVLASFGWNDLASALGPPDRDFQPPPAGRVYLERILLRYRSYLVLRRYAAGAPPMTSGEVGRRVPLTDYRANLREFQTVSRAHGADLVLLTRPHRDGDELLATRAPNWRAEVPSYNDAVRELSAGIGATLIDVERAFEGRAELFVDECHFAPDGHQRMAELVRDELFAAGLLP